MGECGLKLRTTRRSGRTEVRPTLDERGGARRQGGAGGEVPRAGDFGRRLDAIGEAARRRGQNERRGRSGEKKEAGAERVESGGSDERSVGDEAEGGAFDDVAGIAGGGVRAIEIGGRVMVDEAVKEFVESGGFEVAVQRRRQPEGGEGEGENATQARHGREGARGRAGCQCGWRGGVGGP